MRIFTHLNPSSALPKAVFIGIFGLSILGASTPATAQSGGLSALFGQKSQQFLPVNQAFRVSIRTEGDEVVASFKVTPKHYVYRDKLSLRLPDGVTAGEWRFDKSPSMIDDPEFGNVAVFEEDVVARATISGQADGQAALRWQGCAKAGLCYPPETTKFTIAINHDGQSQTTKKTEPIQQPTQPKSQPANQKTDHQADKTAQSSANNDKLTTIKNTDNAPLTDKSSTATDNITHANIATPIIDGDTADDDKPFDDSQAHANVQTTPNSPDGKANANDTRHTLDHTLEQAHDPFGIHDKPVLAVGLLFLAGLLLAFTPCVYPMIPIVANIVARQDGVNGKKGLLLSLSYGVGVATAYGLLGALIAWLGRAVNVVGYLQNPAVLIGFAVLFVLLGLYMFDALKISLPASVRDKLQRTSQAADGRLGSLGGSFLVGLLSALVVSPCVSAPMAGALAAVSVSGSVAFGFVALFALGFGLSVPLVLVGVAQGRFMPKAGVWMIHVKEFCGLLLFAVAIALIERVLVSSGVLVIWAVWFAVVAVWLWRLGRVWLRMAAVLSAIWTACLIVGAGMGSKDAWRPLAVINQTATATHQDIHTTSLKELDDILATHDKVLIDLTADWCVECRIMERELFINRPSAMNGVQMVKFDITDTTDDSRAILARYGLMGPPALLMYQDGKLINVLLGEVKRAEFENALGRFNQ